MDATNSLTKQLRHYEALPGDYIPLARKFKLFSQANSPQILLPHRTHLEMENLVKTSLAGGVGRIRLSRPEKRNALKREFIEQILGAVKEFSVAPELRVLIFEAEGSVFCAGMDLGEMQARAESDAGSADWQRDSEIYAELLAAVYELPVPTIVALQGPALAGGVGLILACDFIVAAETAFVMLPEPARGITAAMVTPFLIHRIGAGAATQLLLSGEKMSADRAHSLGLVYQVAASSELSEAVDSLVGSMLTGSRSALQITKDHIRHCSGTEIPRLLADSIGVSAKARETADAREGLAAFLEKRKPNWQPE